MLFGLAFSTVHLNFCLLLSILVPLLLLIHFSLSYKFRPVSSRSSCLILHSVQMHLDCICLRVWQEYLWLILPLACDPFESRSRTASKNCASENSSPFIAHTKNTVLFEPKHCIKRDNVCVDTKQKTHSH